MIEKKVKYKGKEVICKVDFQFYSYNGAISCSLEMQDTEPFIITMCFNMTPPLAFGNFIDIKNNPDILVFLKDNDFGIVTELAMRKGYYLYPLFVFNKKLVKEANPSMYENYIKMYGNKYSIKDI